MRDSERAAHQLQDWIERNIGGANRCWEIEEGRSRWQRVRDAVTGRDVREEVIACIEGMHERNPAPDTATRAIGAIIRG